MFNNVIDPALLRLSRSTISVLSQAGFKCLEDLFCKSEAQFKSISGVGAKRVREIMEFLNTLPFDYMDQSLPGNPTQDPLAGVDSVLSSYINGPNFSYIDNDGISYFKENRVGNIKEIQATPLVLEMKVKGTHNYVVTIKFEDIQKLNCSCTCPAYMRWGYYDSRCKHIDAALLAIAEQQRLNLFQDTVKKTNYAFHQVFRSLKLLRSELPFKSSDFETKLDYILVYSGDWELYPSRIYPRARHKRTLYSFSYGSKNPWEELAPTNPRDRLSVNYLEQLYQPDSIGYMRPKKSTTENYSIGDVLDIIVGRRISLDTDEEGYEQLEWAESQLKPRIGFKRGKAEDDESPDFLELHFQLTSNDHTISANKASFISQNPCWVLYNKTLYKTVGSAETLAFFQRASVDKLRVPINQMETFLKEYYPLLQDNDVPIQFDEDLTKKIEATPVPRLYLNEHGKKLHLKLRFSYLDTEIAHTSEQAEFLIPPESPSENDDPLSDNKNELLRCISRQFPQEQKWLAILEKHDLLFNENEQVYTPKGSPLEWVVEHLSKLAHKGFEIYGQNKLKRFAKPKKLSSSSFKISSGEQWFELEGSLQFEDYSISINDIEQVLLKNPRYVRLNDGSTGELPGNWVERIKKLLRFTDPEKTKSRIPKIAAPEVNRLTEDADYYESDATFEAYAQKIRAFEKIEHTDPPEHFKGTLRSYQKAGLSWLYFLHKYEFGGILADDMGLGKTVQVLALFQKLREEKRKTLQSLIVAPLSVIHNWKAEAERFLPHLSIYIHHGTERLQGNDDWPDYDLWFTSYGTMRIDAEMLGKKHFDYIIFDESHNIRNPAAKTFKATRKLSSSHRLCLTGTPVQNTTMDLWPQFDLLNPG